MQKTIFIFSFLLIAKFSFAQQNLVPNPSFENYSICPYDLDQMYKSIGWSSYLESPNYYNSCDTNFVDVPSNPYGYQNAASGNAYGGLITYCNQGFAREIIGGQLSQNLIIGQNYFVSIKVSLSEFQGPPPQYIPTDKIGVKFSMLPYSIGNPVAINNSAHIYASTIISDTLNWTTIRGTFIADSNYQYVMIGNFFDDANTDTINTINGVYSYFFVDDVCVSTDSLTCYNPEGTTEIQNFSSFEIYPNPANNILFFEHDISQEYLISVYNSIGQVLFREKLKNENQIDISDFPNGIYFINAQSDKKNTTRKFSINHL